MKLFLRKLTVLSVFLSLSNLTYGAGRVAEDPVESFAKAEKSFLEINKHNKEAIEKMPIDTTKPIFRNFFRDTTKITEKEIKDINDKGAAPWLNAVFKVTEEDKTPGLQEAFNAVIKNVSEANKVPGLTYNSWFKQGIDSGVDIHDQPLLSYAIAFSPEHALTIIKYGATDKRAKNNKSPSNYLARVKDADLKTKIETALKG